MPCCLCLLVSFAASAIRNPHPPTRYGSILIARKIRRLPVVDGEGKLVGLISRGNIVKAALSARKAMTASNN